MKKVFLPVLIALMISMTGVVFAAGDMHSTSNVDVYSQPQTNTTLNTSSTTNVAGDSQVFEAGNRPYPIGQVANFAALPSYFGDNNKPGHQFIPLDKIIMYTPLWDLKSIDKMDGARSWGENLNITPLVSKVNRDSRSKTILVTKKMMDTNQVDVWQLAFGTLNSTNEDILSSDLFAGILKAASLYGATHVQFFAEGTNTELETEGVGIGFNYTKATDSSVSTGGTGWSKGWSGYHNLPWLQFAFLRVEPKESMATVGSAPVKPMPEVPEIVVPSGKIANQSPEVDMAVKNYTNKQQ